MKINRAKIIMILIGLCCVLIPTIDSRAKEESNLAPYTYREGALNDELATEKYWLEKGMMSIEEFQNDIDSGGFTGETKLEAQTYLNEFITGNVKEQKFDEIPTEVQSMDVPDSIMQPTEQQPSTEHQEEQNEIEIEQTDEIETAQTDEIDNNFEEQTTTIADIQPKAEVATEESTSIEVDITKESEKNNIKGKVKIILLVASFLIFVATLGTWIIWRKK